VIGAAFDACGPAPMSPCGVTRLEEDNVDTDAEEDSEKSDDGSGSAGLGMRTAGARRIGAEADEGANEETRAGVAIGVIGSAVGLAVRVALIPGAAAGCKLMGAGRLNQPG
jgi:hypothetical protein